MSRENGFYWVKRDHEWVVLQWLNNEWLIPGTEFNEPDSFMDEIDENKLQRLPPLYEIKLSNDGKIESITKIDETQPK